jgi:hypothetical protein
LPGSIGDIDAANDDCQNALDRAKLRPIHVPREKNTIATGSAVHLQSNAISNAELTIGGRHMGRKVKERKSKGRKSKGRKRKSEWWSENFFAIRDLIWAIYFRVEEPDPAKPSVDDLFRKLRARIDTFEAQCRQKAGAR